MGNFDQTYRLDTQAKETNRSYIERNEDIDVDRLVWDVEYRELVKRILQPRGGMHIPLGI